MPKAFFGGTDPSSGDLSRKDQFQKEVDEYVFPTKSHYSKSDIVWNRRERKAAVGPRGCETCGQLHYSKPPGYDGKKDWALDLIVDGE